MIIIIIYNNVRHSLNAAGSGIGGRPDILRTDRAYFDQSLNIKSCVSNVIHNVDILNFRDAGKLSLFDICLILC